MTTKANTSIMDKTISTASYTVSGATAAGGLLSLNNIALLLGIIFTVVTFALNWWYQHRKHQLAEKKAEQDHRLTIEKAEQERQFHEARMKQFDTSEKTSVPINNGDGYGE